VLLLVYNVINILDSLVTLVTDNLTVYTLETILLPNFGFVVFVIEKEFQLLLERVEMLTTRVNFLKEVLTYSFLV
jgi:hypothetical protein